MMGLEAAKLRVKSHPSSLKQGYKRLEVLILLPLYSNHIATTAEHWNLFLDAINGVASSSLAIMNRAYFQVWTTFARSTKNSLPVPKQAGCFTSRCRMMRGFRKSAFSALSLDLLRAWSVSVQNRERGGVRICPVDKAVVERLKTKVCQPFDEGENLTHRVRYLFVKMSRWLHEILLFGVGREQETCLGVP